MAVHLVESVFPDVDTPELTDALDELLPRVGYSIEERLVLAEGEIFPALGSALGRHPGAGALTAFARPSEACAPATVLSARPAPDGRWDPSLVRTLSHALGGYGVAMEAYRGRGYYGLAVFYAGHTVELESFDYEHGALHLGASRRRPQLDEEETYAGFFHHWRVLAEGVASDLQPGPTTRPRAWIVRPPLSDNALGDTSEPCFCRAAFGPVEASSFGDAIHEIAPAHSSAGRWLPRLTFGARVPFVLLDRDGPLDEVLVSELSRRLDVFFTAIELRGPDLPFRWLDGQGDSIQAGSSRGAAELWRLWNGFSVCLGATAGQVRWPAGERGHP